MSDRNKLYAAATKLGCENINQRSTADELREAIAEKLGVVDAEGSLPAGEARDLHVMRTTDSYAQQIADDNLSVAGPTGAVVGGRDDIPNLTPNGKWQGKRARVVRVQTGNADMAGAIFRWNGWPTLIPISRECDVAWPIFEIMRNAVGVRGEVRQEFDPNRPGVVKNRLETTKYQKYPYQFIGVTPGTEHLPESAWEYTLDSYADDFEGFTVRMWRQICTLWEMTDAESGVEPGMSPDAELGVRRNAVHFKLNLPLGVDRETRLRVRDQKRADIGMPAKAA